MSGVILVILGFEISWDYVPYNQKRKQDLVKWLPDPA